MSIEFIASIQISEKRLFFNSLMSALSKIKGLLLKALNNSCITGTFKDAKHREFEDATWHEDMFIEIETDGIYVAFHSATTKQRDEIIKCMEEALYMNGFHIEFEEI